MDPNANGCRSSRVHQSSASHPHCSRIHPWNWIAWCIIRPDWVGRSRLSNGADIGRAEFVYVFLSADEHHGIKGDRCDLMEESWAKQMVNNMHAWPRKRQQLRVPRTRELSFFADVRPVGFRQEARREERSAPCSSRSKMLQGHRGLCVQGDRVSADWRTSPLVLTPGSVKLPMQGVDRVKGFDKRLVTTLSDASPGLAQ